MRKYTLQITIVISIILGVLATGWWAFAATQKNIPDQTWSQTSSVVVRFGVKADDRATQNYDGLFTVSVLDYPNGELRHKTNKTIVPGQYTYLSFPDDFHVKGLPGKYEWTCTVNNIVVAKGQFEYTGERSQVDQVRILK